ncbi:sodium:proton antiporter NhaD [Lewinella sp. LCG006]|uniref:sodium:proton antiporter NhaD n=1 Tax=Lewinella sp. LCG006 TaxID=3231911 RepID=UPI0034600DCC
MYGLIIVVFVLGYIFIAFEHPLKIDKAASAILTGVLCWTLLVIGQEAILPESGEGFIDEAILHHVGEIAEILFFLLGAMTIVELVDAHEGFAVVTARISTTNKVKLLWIICIVTFFFSAVLDNMTTAIVMAALLRKLIVKKEDLWFFAGMVVLAANAGGAWSPIGDVTTIMLWIGGQVTALNIVIGVFLPSLVCLIVPLLVVTFTQKGEIKRAKKADHESVSGRPTPKEQALIFWLGVAGLLFVPVFKNLTHLPPFMGMLLSLGVLWVTTEILHRDKTTDNRRHLSVAGVIRKVDTPSVLFFLGILLAVASLQTAGHLGQLATAMNEEIGNIYLINVLIGLLSSVVDNVPLVAGAMGMYPLSVYPTDATFWEFLAYCAGTGGSALIIGSAAGVAIMGILKIDFLWYFKKITWLALLGYFSGALVYYLLHAG